MTRVDRTCVTKRPGRLALLLAAALVVSSASGQALLVNGDFASDLTGWQDLGVGQLAWSPLDIAASASSGSALLGSADPLAGRRLTILRQCRPVTPSHSYLVGAAGFIPGGQVGGRLVFSYALRANAPDCVGGSIALGGFFLTAINAWQTQTVHLKPGPLPPTATIEILLSVEKDPAGTSFAGHFDAVRFDVDGLFLAGFE